MRALLGFLLLVSGPVAIAMTATPASAGDSPLLTVTKVVDGTAPPGAQYTVDIDCVPVGGGGGQPTATPSQMTFTGPGSQTAQISDTPTTCTVVETVTSGATVTYACEITMDPGGAADCAGANAVDFEGGSTAATITVTNSFAPAPPEPAPTPAAEPMTAPARFTG